MTIFLILIGSKLDPAVSRFTAMRASIFEHWKPNWTGFFRWTLITFIPIAALAGKMHKDMVIKTFYFNDKEFKTNILY